MNVADTDGEVDFSIVVPAFNEADGIVRVVERLVDFLERSTLRGEAIVVDDGSTDATAALVAPAVARHPDLLRLVRHDVNRGLVAGLATGVAAARSGIVVVLDADLSYAPEIVPPLVEAVRGGVDVALASPYMRGGRVSHVPFVRLAASRGANAILWACSGGRIATFTGMVRAYRREVLEEYLRREPVGEFNAWLVIEALGDDRSIVEIPAHLDWPPERYVAPPRLPAGKLYRRMLAVIRNTRILLLKSPRRPRTPRV